MPNCPTCQKSLDTEHGVKCHHKSVHGVSISGVEKSCDNCGNTYTVSPSREDESRFCSKECLWDGDTSFTDKEIVCEQCGDIFEHHRDYRFCSHECYGDWLSENNVGENHQNWKEGTASYRGPSWDEIREDVFKEFGKKCSECGMGQQEHIEKYGQEIHIHHIEPFRNFDSHKEANRIENLEPLCARCHKEKE